jgi:uncharacterized metal-binding protein
MVKERKVGQSNENYSKINQNEDDDKIKIKDPNESFKKKLNFIVKYLNVILAVTLILSVYFYKESLRGCFGTQAECLKNLNEGEVRALLALISRSGLILAVTITIVIYGFANKIFLFAIAAIYGFLCFYYDVGADLDYHGAYNRVLLLLLFVLWFACLNLIVFIIRGFRRVPIITGIILLVALSSLYAFYRIRVKTSCKDWLVGLKGVKLDQSKMPCKFQVPEECWIDVFEGLFDYSGWFKDNCSVIRNGDRSLYDKYFKEKNPNYLPTTLIGFPRTENYTYDDSVHFVLDYKIMRELIDMNDPNVSEEVKKRTEVMIDYRGEESKVIIRIFRDENLIRQRLPLYQRLGKALQIKNLMIIYVDALSRRHFLRKMKKTTAWLEKFYKSDHPRYTSYQFLKYHSIGYFTQINTIPAFLGKWWLEAGGNYYTKYWKEKGAITSQSISFCGRELFDLENDQFRHMNWESYDHEHIALFCDPNYNQADNPYTPFLGAYSVRRRCLHGKETNDYQLEYGYKFWETYKDMPKVLRMDFIDAHEGSMEVVKYLDDKLEKFLLDLEENDLLEDTFLLFMADHGNNMPGFVSLMDPMDFKIEKYLPMMYLVVPEKFRKVYGQNLENNEQSIITAWDIHNTLLQIGGAPINAQNPYGTSMLKKIPNERFHCRKFLIRDDQCYCKPEYK